MTKVFNTTGWCNPKEHYTVDVSKKFEQTLQMVEQGKYFTINRPHQYGKTSMLEMLYQELTKRDDYLVFNISFEGLDDAFFNDSTLFCKHFLLMLYRQMIEQDEKELASFIKNEAKQLDLFIELTDSITAIAHVANRKMVLLIDEVDSTSNHELFLKFLGILRRKYLKRHLKTEKTFQSIVLVGVHDIKSLKLKIGSGATGHRYNSPWNIATNFEIDMSFKVEEIIPMLEDYVAEKQVTMNTKAIAAALVQHTSGYPFLVSALCKTLDEKILPTKSERTWTVKEVEQAVQYLVSSPISNTNFDHLIKSLENNPKSMFKISPN